MSEELPCVKALMSYKQADEHGVLVTVSRQAIHETVEEIRRLTIENEKLTHWHETKIKAARDDALGEAAAFVRGEDCDEEGRYRRWWFWPAANADRDHVLTRFADDASEYIRGLKERKP